MDPNSSLRMVLAVGAVALLIVAAGIVRVQRRAMSCPVHSQRVGTAAWVVAGVCGVVGAGLLLYALIVA